MLSFSALSVPRTFLGPMNVKPTWESKGFIMQSYKKHLVANFSRSSCPLGLIFCLVFAAELASPSDPQVLWAYCGGIGGSPFIVAPDEKTFYSCGSTVKRIDLASGQLIESFKVAPNSSVHGRPWIDPTGRDLQFVTTSSVAHFDLTTGELKTNATGWFRPIQNTSRPTPGSYSFTSDGRNIVVGGDYLTRSSALIDATSGAAIKVYVDSQTSQYLVSKSACSQVGDFGAVSGQSTRVFSIPSGKVVSQVPVSFSDIDLSMDSRHAWLAAQQSVWDVSTPEAKFVASTSSGVPYFSSDGSQLHVVQAGAVDTFETTDWRLLSHDVHPKQFGSDQSYFLSGSSDYLLSGKSLGLFRPGQSLPIKEYSLFSDELTSFTLSPSGKYIVFEARTPQDVWLVPALFIIDASTGLLKYRLVGARSPFQISNDETTISAITTSNSVSRISFFNFQDGSAMSSIPTEGGIKSLLSPDGKICFRLYPTWGEIQRFSTFDGKQMSGKSNPAFEGTMVANVSADGSNLVLAAYDSLTIVRLSDFAILKKVPTISSIKYAVESPGDGSHLYSLQEGKTWNDLHKIDVSGAVDQTLASGIRSYSVSRNGAAFATNLDPWHLRSTTDGTILESFDDPRWVMDSDDVALSPDAKSAFHFRHDGALFCVQF